MGRNKNQEGVQQLPWTSDGNAAIWRLVSALEEPDNRRKLFGKNPTEVKWACAMLGMCSANTLPRSATQNTSGDSKIKIYGRIAESIWPALYKENAKTVTSRTKAKSEWWAVYLVPSSCGR